jgi:hypothetical protein
MIAVFVSSKSYIYITPTPSESKVTLPNVDNNETLELPQHCEPIYENIENDGGIVTADNNKFTIYVNYDFINGEKSGNKSSVRLLEPDVKLVHMNLHLSNVNDAGIAVVTAADDDDDDDCDEKRQKIISNGVDNDEENKCESMLKMIQCQQISMYIGEKIFRDTLIIMNVERIFHFISLVS